MTKWIIILVVAMAAGFGAGIALAGGGDDTKAAAAPPGTMPRALQASDAAVTVKRLATDPLPPALVRPKRHPKRTSAGATVTPVTHTQPPTTTSTPPSIPPSIPPSNPGNHGGGNGPTVTIIR
jgi:hypothetical protein